MPKKGRCIVLKIDYANANCICLVIISSCTVLFNMYVTGF